MSSVTFPVVPPDGLKALIKLPNKILHVQTQRFCLLAPSIVGICQPTLDDSIHQKMKHAHFKTIHILGV